MSWVFFALLSAFFLGCYNLSVKHAVRDNAVLPVLFFSNALSALVWLAVMGAARSGVGIPDVLRANTLTGTQHLEIIARAALIATMWMLMYCGVKQLPVSIAGPIQSTNPLWMLVGAVIVLGERLTMMQWLGVAVTIGAFFALSMAGAREGVNFLKNRAVWLLLAGVILAAPSGLYDKWLLGHEHISSATLQTWFSIYLALLFLPIMVLWKFRLWKRSEFHWRWSILLVSLFLLTSDFFFFQALRSPDGLLSIVASIKRSEVLVTFIGGAVIFHENHVRQKIPIVIALLLGVVITMLG